jgi:hypothetical protein
MAGDGCPSQGQPLLKPRYWSHPTWTANASSAAGRHQAPLPRGMTCTSFSRGYLCPACAASTSSWSLTVSSGPVSRPCPSRSAWSYLVTRYT